MDKPKQEDAGKGYDFSRSIMGHKQFKFGPRDSNTITVDMSLANLFQRLTVECSGILGNPQWKHFRHMELLKTDQIRLSNGIWRSWHMQFQKGLEPLFCTFEIDPRRDVLSHSQPQAVVIEGKYWKRTDAAVAMEYRKWRLFYKQKLNWPKIRRLPNATAGPTGPSSSKQQQQFEPMQAESSDFKLNQIFQAIDDFPDSIFMDIPRLGDERSYMRPLVDSAEMIQQPYLGMLNPHVGEMVLEPMEVMFSSLNLPNRFSGNFSAIGSSFNSQQQQSVDQSDARLTQRRDNAQSYSNTMQYENQTTTPSFINIPPQRGLFNQLQSGAPFGMNPSNFLNMPVDSRARSQSNVVMDIGTPPIDPMVKPDASKVYNSGQTTPTTQYQQPQSYIPSVPSVTTSDPQDKIGSLLSQFLSEGSNNSSNRSRSSTPQQTTPTNYNYSNPQPMQVTSTPPSFRTPPIQQQQPMRNLDTEKLTGEIRGKTELELRLIAEQMKQLEEEHLKHLQELEQQQQIASRQYLELLQEYLNKSGCQPPSQQQHQVLMSVLSDPTSLSILKAIFKDDASPVGEVTFPTLPQNNIISEIKTEHESPQQSANVIRPYSAQSNTTTSLMRGDPASAVDKLMLETSTKDVGTVSEFQSRLIMAAAAQATTLGSTDTSSQTMYQTIQPKPNSSLIASPPATITDSDMPPSPALMKKFKNARNLTPEEKNLYQELRRQSHITAEQRRRGSIKNGFDHLQSLVINPASFPSGKISKATILEKTIEQMHNQHHERENREKRIKKLKEEMQQLNDAIVFCQEKLPASGAPVTRQRFEENRQLFREYIRQGTQHNYKFWIYSIIIQQLFDSYNSMVSTASADELRQTVLGWFEQSCGLPSLRPVVMSSLRELSMKTSILSDPSKVPDQLTESVARSFSIS